MTAPVGSPPMTQVDRAASLAELLVLEPLGDDRFLAPHPSHDPFGHTYGGQLAAQAMRAAADTVTTDRLPHSLHGYFLRAGSLDVPLIVDVDRERDGRAFSARHVRVTQGDDIVFSALVSFHRDEQTIDHHVHPLAPDAGDPDLLPEQPARGSQRAARGAEPAAARHRPLALGAHLAAPAR